MVDAAVIARKLASARDHLQKAEKRRPRQLDLFLSNEDARDLVVHHLWLGIQDCLDLAMHVVGDEGWGPAQTYGEAFELLRGRGVVPTNLAPRLREAAGLRNLIVHRYGDLSFELIYKSLPRHLRALRAFLAQVAKRYARR